MPPPSQVLNEAANPSLSSLVFGEGVVNDAVSVVLLGALERSTRGGAWGGALSFTASFLFLLASSASLGAAAGLGVAALLKGRAAGGGPHQEVAIVVLGSYASWLLADWAGLSPILALFACGIAASHYALPNASERGRSAALEGVRTLAHIAEGEAPCAGGQGGHEGRGTPGPAQDRVAPSQTAPRRASQPACALRHPPSPRLPACLQALCSSTWAWTRWTWPSGR